MHVWFWFWMISISASALLFFGVAILVAIFGWRDLRDLYAQFQTRNEQSVRDNEQFPE